MPNVTFEKTGNVTGRIAIKITKDELNSKLTEELKKQRQKVSMKGFRKGKTPLSTLLKMMGNQILGQVLDDKIKDALFGYIEENDVKLIFSPVPIEDEGAPMITATALDDVNLAYDLALEPEFELEIPKNTFDKLVLKTDDEFIDKQLSSMLKQAGENTEVEDGKVEDEDVLDVTFTEVGPMDDPITNSTKLYVDSLSDAGKEKVVGKKLGAKVTIEDLNTLEKESTPAYVNKYLLELEDEEVDMSGKAFEITIDKISRIVPAEMDEEFFTKFDASGRIKTEEEVRAKIARDNSTGFNKQGESIADFEIQHALVEGNDIELPLAIMEKIQEDEEGDRDMEMFTHGVKWMLIRNKFAAQENVKLEYEDVKAEALASLMQMLGGQRPDFLTDEFVDNYVGQMLQDEKQREQLSSNAIEKKIMAALRNKVTLKDKPLTADEFNEAIKAFNEENMPASEEE